MEKELLCSTTGALLGLSETLDVALQCITHEALLQCDLDCLSRVGDVVAFLPNHSLHRSSRTLTSAVCILNNLTDEQRALLKENQSAYSPACKLLLSTACAQIAQAVRTRINPDETRNTPSRQEMMSLRGVIHRLDRVYYHLSDDNRFEPELLCLECKIDDILNGNDK